MAYDKRMTKAERRQITSTRRDNRRYASQDTLKGATAARKGQMESLYHNTDETLSDRLLGENQYGMDQGSNDWT